MKHFFCLLLFCFFQLMMKGQGEVLDSLVSALDRSAEDTNKVNTLNELAFEYLYADRIKTNQYAEQALELARQLNFGKGERTALYIDMTATHFEGETEKAIEKGNQLLEIAREAADLPTQARVLNMMSNVYQSINNLEKALEAIQESTRMSIQMGDKNKTAVSYYTTASIYQILNEYDIAISYLEKAIPLLEEENDLYKLGVVYQGLATCTKGEPAIEYAQKGLEMLEQTNDFQGQGHCHWVIASELIQLGKAQEALPSVFKALEIFEEVDYPEGIANMNLIQGNAYLKLGRFQEAYQPLIKAKAIAQERRFDDVLQLTYRNLAEYYGIVGQTDLMSHFLDSFTILRDTLFSREKAQFLIESENRLQTKEKEAQLAQQDLELARQTRLRNITLFGFIIAIISLLAVFQYFRVRQKLKRQQTELSLQLKQAEAEKLLELDQLKSTFFANISHEFRTPLTLILGPINQARDLAQKKKGLEKTEEIPIPSQQLDIMQRNAWRLQKLIDQLLDLSKLESGKMKLQVSQGNIIQFIRAIVFSFESLAERKSIQFHTQFPDDLAQSYFDGDKVTDIIINILSNAFKFTPDHGRIVFYVESQEGGQLNIQIRDSGNGIPPDELDNIFNRFYQVEGTEHQGTGIGLSLVKELIDLHKGSIRVESQVGKGTSFFIHLPYLQEAYSENEKVPIKSVTGKEIKASDLTTIHAAEEINEQVLNSQAEIPVALIIEDNPDLRIFISDYLKNNYQVHLAKDGVEGFEKAIQLIPDIIISDVMMPRMDGFALSEAIKKEEKTSHIPLILLTAKAGQEHKIEGLQTGADDYLTKPFNGQELMVRVHNLIEQRKLLREKFTGQLKIRPSQVSFSSVDQQFIEQVIRQIETHMSNEQFSVEDLARLVNFSRSQLHRKLKALCDKTPVELIRDFRLTRAKEMLEQKAGSVSEIAYEVGYSNLSYFSSSFKKAFGQLPSEI